MPIFKIFSTATLSVTLCLFLFLNSLNVLQANRIADTNTITNSNGISVFFDFTGRIDETYIRQEIQVADYVRDKEMADVHIIMTRHRSGTGTNYAASFIGYNAYENMEYELIYWDDATNTSDETRRGYTNMIKIGLAPFVARAGMSDELSLEYNRTRVVEEEVTDPWNHWVFELSGSGNFNMEETRDSYRFDYGISVNKITEDWKIRFRSNFRYDERNFTRNEDIITSVSTRDRIDGYILKSLTDHWSAGIFSDYSSSTFSNISHSIEMSPALEYSLFPYAEATRRSITFAWRMGGGYYDYIDTTIFDKTEEYLLGQSLDASANFQQPWGSLRIGLEGFHHFHDFRSNRLEFSTRISLRLVQGLSLSVRGGYDLINDLVAIPKEDLSLEEILLQQRRRATDYEISGSIGLSYTFGSRITGVFNPRF